MRGSEAFLPILPSWLELQLSTFLMRKDVVKLRIERTQSKSYLTNKYCKNLGNSSTVIDVTLSDTDTHFSYILSELDIIILQFLYIALDPKPFLNLSVSSMDHTIMWRANDLIIWQLYILEVFIKEGKEGVNCIGGLIYENVYMNQALEHMRQVKDVNPSLFLSGFRIV